MHTKTCRQRKPDQTQTILAALAHPRRRSMLDDLDTDIGWPLANLDRFGSPDSPFD